MRLITTYTSMMADDLAAERMSRLTAAGLDRITFAWAGPTAHRRQALLPRPGADVPHRVRQHAERRQSHPRRVARLPGRLRPRPAARAHPRGPRPLVQFHARGRARAVVTCLPKDSPMTARLLLALSLVAGWPPAPRRRPEPGRPTAGPPRRRPTMPRRAGSRTSSTWPTTTCAAARPAAPSTARRPTTSPTSSRRPASSRPASPASCSRSRSVRARSSRRRSSLALVRRGKETPVVLGDEATFSMRIDAGAAGRGAAGVRRPRPGDSRAEPRRLRRPRRQGQGGGAPVGQPEERARRAQRALPVGRRALERAEARCGAIGTITIPNPKAWTCRGSARRPTG